MNSRIFSQIEKDLSDLQQAVVNNGSSKRFTHKYSELFKFNPLITCFPPKPLFLSPPPRGDDVSILIQERLPAVIKRTFNAAKLVSISETRQLPQSPVENTVVSSTNSKVIHGFTCICVCKYFDHTTRQLRTRIAEHIPKYLRTSGTSVPRSANTEHLIHTGHRIDVAEAF